MGNLTAAVLIKCASVWPSSSWRNTPIGTRMLIAALLVIVGKNPHDCNQHAHSTQCYSRGTQLSMDLKESKLNGLEEIQLQKSCMIPFMWKHTEQYYTLSLGTHIWIKMQGKSVHRHIPYEQVLTTREATGLGVVLKGTWTCINGLLGQCEN